MSEVNCQQVIEELYQWLDGELPSVRCDELQAHVDHCFDCLGRYGLEEHFKQLIRSRCSQKEVPAELIQRIRSILRQEAS
jgi:mycothiol system anti-sigma-R factor